MQVSIHNLDRGIARRLREYVIRTKHIQTVRQYGRVYGRLSSALRGEVAMIVHTKWFEQIHLFRSANERLRVQIALKLQGGVFAPSENMPPTSLYMLHRGVAFINGAVLGGGRAWGLGSLMYSKSAFSSMKTSSTAVAFTYCEVLFMDGIFLREVAERYDTRGAPHTPPCAAGLLGVQPREVGRKTASAS